MPAPGIPNLKSLLANRRGGQQKGRGRGPTAGGAKHESSDAAKDLVVQNTDQDAATSRLSCIELGYLEDAFAKVFATQPTIRRLPLLNRGTYVRTTAIDTLVDKFLSTSPTELKQIVSLGAGTDTRYYRILSKYPSVKVVYHEFDFPSNTTTKIAAIQKTPFLLSHIRQPLSDPSDLKISADKTSLVSPFYNIHPIDLRTLSTSPPPPIPSLSATTPTLLLSECCLIYLQPADASAVLSAFLTTLIPAPTPVALVLYEPIRPDDAFGRTMEANLASRNIHLYTLKKYGSLTRQRIRLKSAGFEHGFRAADTEFIWRKWVTEEEKVRVAALEMLDEFEELELLLRHYCVAWGWRGGGGEGLFERAWAEVREQEGDDEVG
ncbi:leucine carboxyl methyltransferase 1 [Cenococcum geophilum 1.58]|uniref:leucine carboxyl methyltransferase 1 n=1 Tax=Cenococcum geophilum 1.58 TaxID=794803 RepID=UPI00358FE71C|nr:leucine carboxyl methyltransferase 1 [Cenococcum geophilum 1.58]